MNKIIFFILLSFCSCSGVDIDYVVKADFYYINNTRHEIYVVSSFTLQPGETHLIELDGSGDKDITQESYVVPSELGNILIYDKIKCDTLYVGDNARGDNAQGIYGIKNYRYKKIEERYYEFIYTFTEKDYNKALPCNEE